MYAVGIDLGTTNSAVAIMKGRPSIVEDQLGNRTVPSAVGWDPDLETLVVGRDAKDNAEMYKSILSVKRLMGTQERLQVGPHSWLPEEVSAEILKLLKQQVETKTGEQVTDAIITVPAYFQMAACAATKRAGELAGLNVQQLLAEPSAAIMAYGPQDDEKILVYDLGGGTFDVTIMDHFAGVLKTLAVTGNNRLGGDDFDLRLMRHFVEVLKKEQGVSIDLDNDAKARSNLRKKAEEAKIKMSAKPGERVQIPEVTTVGGRPISLNTLVKVEDFNAMIRDLVQGTLLEVEKALKMAKLDKSDIDTVLLVGGSTYVPLVQKTVRDYFNKEPNKKVNPDLAVAEGAAASLVLSGPEEGGRHVVTVGYIPENTPETSLPLEGRTTPNSRVRITGGADAVDTVADGDGNYTADVPLKKGMNSLEVTSVAPDGKKAKLQPEPVVQDPNAKTVAPPAEPPQPTLTHALSVAVVCRVDNQRLVEDHASVVIPAQSSLPSTRTVDKQFSTSQDGQPRLVVPVLEGDLALAGLNTSFADMVLDLPPNVPAGEPVIVRFTIDENRTLTAELECVGRHSEVRIDLKSPAKNLHVMQKVSDFLTKAGHRVRPEESARLQQAKVALEDVNGEVRRVESGNNGDAVWNAYNRLRAEAAKLELMLTDLSARYV